MSTLICPTCGCSLVRLGVPKDKATVYRFERAFGEESGCSCNAQGPTFICPMKSLLPSGTPSMRKMSYVVVAWK